MHFRFTHADAVREGMIHLRCATLGLLFGYECLDDRLLFCYGSLVVRRRSVQGGWEAALVGLVAPLHVGVVASHCDCVKGFCLHMVLQRQSL